MRLVGAALLAAAGLMAGLTGAAGLRRRADRRDEFVRMLAMMEFELGRFSTPLPALFARLGERAAGEAGALCRRVEEGLSALGGRTMEELWGAALEPLPREERRILLPLGQVLGRYGAEEQLAALTACREGMALARDEARAALQERGRMTVGVPVAGALALAVLLL